MDLSDLEAFYRAAKHAYDSDEAFAKSLCNYVVKLQSGDEYCLTMWRKLVDITMAQCQHTYDRLNVTLTRDDTMGESLYNPMLPALFKHSKTKVWRSKMMVLWWFLDEFTNKAGDPMGVIIQKKDGGYLYTTTDIAAAAYRYHTLHADRVILFTDARQTLHAQQAWLITRKAGFVPDEFVMEHFTFGMMLGKDGKPLKHAQVARLDLPICLMKQSSVQPP